MRMNRFVTAITLIVLGSLLAHFVQTGGGDVRIEDVRFESASGHTMSAYLYVPAGATAEKPAPAILAIHGYINSRETQGGFAIEFARRGFVVLALDQTGHGYSDPPAFGEGFGGPAGLAYLRQLPFVDKERIGLEGHSMGGWAVQMAAASDPGGYAAMVLEGSSTGTFGAPVGTPEIPRNLQVVFSRYDEFSALMWGAAVPADVVSTEKLKTLFGTSEPVEINKLYGDISSGTARRLRQPAVTHPGDHLSREAIGDAVSWFELALDQESDLSSHEQTWYWKELGTLIGLLGLVVLIFPLVDWLLGFSFFRGVVSEPPVAIEVPSRRYLINILVTAFVPVLTFFPLQVIGNLILPPNPVLPQQITNGVLVWALGTGLISLVLFIVWRRGRGYGFSDVGMPLSGTVVGKSMLLALACCVGLYVIVLLVDFVLNIDFRVWVVALKHLSVDQFVMALFYLPFFTLFFVVLSLSLHTQLRRGGSLATMMWMNGASLSIGFVVLLLIQYIPLFAGGTMAIASQPLLTIVAFQFVPLLLMVGLVSTFCFYRTNNIFVGAFINSVFITWYMVAGTATQAVPFWQ